MSEKKIRKVNSFVRRNRPMSEQQETFYNDSYAKWGLKTNLNSDLIDKDFIKWDFAKIFGNDNNIILEIGFGNGETLLKNSIDNKKNNYIGIEVYQAGVLFLLTELEKSKNNNSECNIKNLRVCQGDAKLILENNIPNQSLSGVQIFFSDPWPKKKHHKRRLIQTEFMSLLATKIKPGGFVHLATDWANYAEQMLDVLTNHNDYVNMDENNSYYDKTKANRLLTKFEQRGIDKGHQIFDLMFSVK